MNDIEPFIIAEKWFWSNFKCIEMMEKQRRRFSPRTHTHTSTVNERLLNDQRAVC